MHTGCHMDFFYFLFFLSKLFVVHKVMNAGSFSDCISSCCCYSGATFQFAMDSL